MDDQTKTIKTVYTIVDRGQGKAIWVRIGVGHTNRDGSLNLRLDALPVSGTLQVRDWEPYERRPESPDGGFRARAGAAPDARQLPMGSTG